MMESSGDAAADSGSSPDVLFDLASEYDAMLALGLRLSGENRDFFILGRVAELIRRLPAGANVRSILDFGCGIGDTSGHLARVFPNADVTGVDTAAGALEHARRAQASPRVRFLPVDEVEPARYDLCYVNGVFHHIVPSERPRALSGIWSALRAGGWFALFENNPWNVGTRIIMSRVEFDRDAILISPPAARRLLRANGFHTPLPTRFLFIFPHALRFLRPLEGPLSGAPLGGQYLVLGQKPSES